MNEIIEISDPRAKSVEKWAKVGGVAVVATAASVAVIAVGATVITAAVVGVVALAAVNFGVPVAARFIALKKQQTMTKLAEVFSEETIREDERNEGERITILEQQYRTSRSELEGAQEELRQQAHGATNDEVAMLETQISSLQGVIDNAESTLRQRKEDFAELQRVNKLFIAFHRSAAAMEKAQGAERDPAELQRLDTARAAIKTRMRSALAGKTIETMNAQLHQKVDIVRVAQLGNSKPITIPTKLQQEVERVPTRR
jgi:hypothetical protein